MGGTSSILPWDDWIYHVDDKKDEVKKLHSEAVHLHDSIRSEVLYFNSLLTQVKQLTRGNATLVIIIKTLKFDDLKLKQFEVELDALPPPPKGSIPAKFAGFITEVTGSFLVLKGVFNIGKLAKSSLFAGDVALEGGAEAGLEGLAEVGAELGIEGGIEVAAEIGLDAALADSGIGIIAAVSLDIIFGAINGAKEAKELDKQIGSLRDSVSKLKNGLAEIMAKKKRLQKVSVDEEARFKALAVSLQKIISYRNAPDWDGLAISLPNLPTFLAHQHEAIRYYGLLSQLRVTFLRAKARVPNVQKEAIISAVLIKVKADVTYVPLEQLWAVLEKYSVGMKESSDSHWWSLVVSLGYQLRYHFLLGYGVGLYHKYRKVAAGSRRDYMCIKHPE